MLLCCCAVLLHRFRRRTATAASAAAALSEGAAALTALGAKQDAFYEQVALLQRYWKVRVGVGVCVSWLVVGHQGCVPPIVEACCSPPGPRHYFHTHRCARSQPTAPMSTQ
jgi:hypothetical protein